MKHVKLIAVLVLVTFIIACGGADKLTSQYC